MPHGTQPLQTEMSLVRNKGNKVVATIYLYKKKTYILITRIIRYVLVGWMDGLSGFC